MLKRILYFGNPVYLSLENHQLVIQKPGQNEVTAPIEDIGVILLDHPQITITHPLMVYLMEQNVALISCNAKHHPIGLMLTLVGNTIQTQRQLIQIEVSKPLKKQLWQQTIKAKIANQAAILDLYHEEDGNVLRKMSQKVLSGDSSNLEARAAVYYWARVFPENPFFIRDDFGEEPNAALNYGYAILRAITARSIVASGLIPSIGIFHRNKYNAFCLADDLMEPYRPFVDYVVMQMIEEGYEMDFLNTETKKRLLSIPAMDVFMEGQTSPLMVAVSRTTSSLFKSYEQKETVLLYPELIFK